MRNKLLRNLFLQDFDNLSLFFNKIKRIYASITVLHLDPTSVWDILGCKVLSEWDILGLFDLIQFTVLSEWDMLCLFDLLHCLI
ncbi:hypothetical protein L6452_15893 [Arctium lappa]|uniref:Uncharacterized protein n=1 Tax=Arctium lappa TaxID=4217 RepID=A0ACB9CPX9_ARCLA|nr:hypothetical protein L6452_15893 [Arctium lappa]